MRRRRKIDGLVVTIISSAVAVILSISAATWKMSAWTTSLHDEVKSVKADVKVEMESAKQMVGEKVDNVHHRIDELVVAQKELCAEKHKDVNARVFRLEKSSNNKDTGNPQ